MTNEESINEALHLKEEDCLKRMHLATTLRAISLGAKFQISSGYSGFGFGVLNGESLHQAIEMASHRHPIRVVQS